MVSYGFMTWFLFPSFVIPCHRLVARNLVQASKHGCATKRAAHFRRSWSSKIHWTGRPRVFGFGPGEWKRGGADVAQNEIPGSTGGSPHLVVKLDTRWYINDAFSIVSSQLHLCACNPNDSCPEIIYIYIEILIDQSNMNQRDDTLH